MSTFTRDPATLNGRPFNSCDPSYGPVYPRMPELDAWRRLANSRDLSDGETASYGRAVLDAIHRLNRPAGAMRISLACTAWTPERGRAEQSRRIAAALTADRHRRTDAEIIAAYEEAMAAKREREASEALLARPAPYVAIQVDLPAPANDARPCHAAEPQGERRPKPAPSKRATPPRQPVAARAASAPPSEPAPTFKTVWILGRRGPQSMRIGI